MKKRILFFVLFLIPVCGMSQAPSPRSDVASLDVNLAFGPSTTATWDLSLGYRFQVSDQLRVGIGDLSYGNATLASGTRNAIMLGPVVEYLLPATGNISYSILAGIPIQNRWGANIDHAFGVAPYGEGMVDYHFNPQFSLAGIIKAQFIVSDAYLRMPRVLPSSAVILALGVGFHFYL